MSIGLSLSINDFLILVDDFFPGLACMSLAILFYLSSLTGLGTSGSNSTKH
jgi:hypothetical protein